MSEFRRYLTLHMHEDRNINQQICSTNHTSKKSIEFYVTSVALLDQDSSEYL